MWLMSDDIYITRGFLSHDFIIFTLFRPEDLHKEKKFIVSVSALDKLLKVCSACGGTADYEQLQEEGAYARFVIRCPHCLHHRTWETTPKIGHAYAINVIMCGAMLFVGAPTTKVLSVFERVSIQMPCYDTYMQIQADYLFGVSWNVIICRINKITWPASHLQYFGKFKCYKNILEGIKGECVSPLLF